MDSPASNAPVGNDAVFGQVLVGIDETPESLLAAAQANVLRRGVGRLVLLAVAERYLAAHAGFSAADAAAHLEQDARADLMRAAALADADETAVASGRLVAVLRQHLERRGATLIAVGVRPHRRVGSATFGGHDIEALHDAPGSVLIARPGWGPRPPDRVVVALDATPASRTAEEVARQLARRLQRELVPVVALGPAVDPEVLPAACEDAVLEPGTLADAVTRNSGRSSLVVVGRDSATRQADVDRLVFRSRCSVLVVDHPVQR